ncbi:hypothetical protein [Inquilinus limosus]|uniref:Uncharacterized protein n=1 Tax=Inquilinus limosus MP06 TaxID=1398085 RepID=A0A0A0DBQ3_9PROT|nr:hypothetical protein [Inquilinus limosus]KGM36146.1 hypothetical protein P409_00425 [Inquilinus limosus MP06]
MFSDWCSNPKAGHGQLMRAGMQIREQRRADAVVRSHNRRIFFNADKPGTRWEPPVTADTRRRKVWSAT